MFEFAISQHRKRPPTRRFIFSVFLSLLGHGFLLLILFLFPELLEPGRHLWFRPPILTTSAEEALRWRTVIEVGGAGRMAGPSTQTLKKYIYDWSKARGGGANPPIHVSFRDSGEDQPGHKEPLPAFRPELGTNEPKPAPQPVASATGPDPAAAGEGGVSAAGKAAPGFPVEVTAGSSSAEKKGSLYLPAPSQTAPKQPPRQGPTPSPTPASIPSQVAENLENRTTTQSPPRTQDPAKVFTKEQSALRTEGSGLFDTKGFPLGDYANLIVERIKGNWSIPSNLRDSQGRTTIIFYIEKDGQYTGLRVASTSGISSLDLAALNSILGSNPFPPLPKGFPGQNVGAKILFSYNERQ